MFAPLSNRAKHEILGGRYYQLMSSSKTLTVAFAIALCTICIATNIVGKWTGRVEVPSKLRGRVVPMDRMKALQAYSKKLVYNFEFFKGGRFHEVFHNPQVPPVTMDGIWQVKDDTLVLTYLKQNSSTMRKFIDRYRIEKGEKRIVQIEERSVTLVVLKRG